MQYPKRIRIYGIEPDCVGRSPPTGICPSPGRTLKQVLPFKRLQHLRQIRSEVSAVPIDRNGEFRCRAEQVSCLNDRVARIHNGMLGGSAEEDLWMPHEVLVERVLKTDKDGEGFVTPATGSACTPSAATSE